MVIIDTENFTKEEFKNYLLKLWERQDVNISSKELSEIRKKVDKALLKIDSDYYQTMDFIANINILHLGESRCEEDYNVFNSEQEYNEALKEYIAHGWSKEGFEKLVRADLKRLNEIKIMKYRFKYKYSWNKISQEIGLSERQCQRIKDKILNKYIIDMLEDKNYITYHWREGF